MSASSSGDPCRTVHQPVLVRDVLRLLAVESGQTVVDGTVGAGGHSQSLLEQIGPGGVLIGLDRDPQMLVRAGAVLDAPNCHLIHAGYSRLRSVLDQLDVPHVDRILLDLGYSSDQLADEQRGFRFNSDGPLDLRFDTSWGRPAYELLRTAAEEELERILRDFGEERHARKIAAEIVRRRRTQPVATARQLAELAAETVGGSRGRKHHPATLVFQALRIAVNDELGLLETTLREVFPGVLAPGGRAAVISFHSLEDRLVKHAFRDKDQWENLTAKPVTATAVERKINPRSRSAKLRVAIIKPPDAKEPT
ncbi:MAG: 16S rRNA (cytosine(1402)-N(4))-methyltransferase RsmH [Planctomycetaceae bacterium]